MGRDYFYVYWKYSSTYSQPSAHPLYCENSSDTTKNISATSLIFSVTGVYLISFNSFDIYFMAIVALISLVLRVIDYPMPPLILGFILGGMMEKNLRRALIINDGSYSFLWERPISLTLFIIMIIIILIQVYQGLIKKN